MNADQGRSGACLLTYSSIVVQNTLGHLGTVGAAAAAAGSRSTVRCTMRNACAHVNERTVMSDLGKFLRVDVGCLLLKYYIRKLA